MHNSTLQNNITIHTVHPSIRIQTVHNEVYNTLLHHIEEINVRRHSAGWSGHYYLWACHRACSAVSYQRWVYGKPASIKEQHENE
jgi:hypothetical protein